MFIDHLARAAAIPVKHHQFGGLLGAGPWDGRQITLFKPLIYMNRSGHAVGQLLRSQPVPATHLWVVHDDLDLPLGTLRIRSGGSAGGHRGVAHIAQILADQKFGRFRLGIGRPPGKQNPADFVLDPFNADEEEQVLRVLDQAVAAAAVLIDEGPQAAMSRFNGPVG